METLTRAICAYTHAVVYKPRLEKLLADILLITEVAELASEADTLSAIASAGHTSINAAVAEKKSKGMLSAAQWKSLKEFDSPETGQVVESSSDLDSSGLLPEVASGSPPMLQMKGVTDQDEDDLTDSDGSVDNDLDSESDETIDSENSTDNAEDAFKFRRTTSRSVASAAVSTSKIKRLLDRWEEPVSKNEKVSAWCEIGQSNKGSACKISLYKS